MSEIDEAVYRVMDAWTRDEEDSLREAAAELWRLTRHPAADYARQDYEMHNGD